MTEEGTRKKSRRGGTRGGASIIFQDEQILGILLVFKLNIKDRRGQEEGRQRGGACLSGRSQRFFCILKGLSKSHNLGSLCTILVEQRSRVGRQRRRNLVKWAGPKFFAFLKAYQKVTTHGAPCFILVAESSRGRGDKRGGVC